MTMGQVADFIEEKSPVTFSFEDFDGGVVVTMYFKYLHSIGYSIQYECENSEEMIDNLQKIVEMWLWDGVVEFIEAYGNDLKPWDKAKYLKEIPDTYASICERINTLKQIGRYHV